MFTKLLYWIRCTNEREVDEDGNLIANCFDYDPTSYWMEIAVRGGKYVMLEYSSTSEVIDCECLTIFEEFLIFDNTPSSIYINPPLFPQSLDIFTEYEFQSISLNDRYDIEDYVEDYVNCLAKVRRKLLDHRIQDLLKRCSSYDQKILRIVIFYLPNLDINYHLIE